MNPYRLSAWQLVGVLVAVAVLVVVVVVGVSQRVSRVTIEDHPATVFQP